MYPCSYGNIMLASATGGGLAFHYHISSKEKAHHLCAGNVYSHSQNRCMHSGSSATRYIAISNATSTGRRNGSVLEHLFDGRRWLAGRRAPARAARGHLANQLAYAIKYNHTEPLVKGFTAVQRNDKQGRHCHSGG